MKFTLIGAISWLCDRIFCNFLSHSLQFNPQLHAWWHIFTSLALLEAYAQFAILHTLEIKFISYNDIQPLTVFSILTYDFKIKKQSKNVPKTSLKSKKEQ